MGVILPATYKRVEYIEQSSDTGAWIDTGIVPDQTTYARIKVMNLAVSGDVILGYFIDDQNDWRLFNFSQNCYVDMPNKSAASGSTGPRLIWRGNKFVPGQIYEFEIGNQYITNLRSGESRRDASVPDFTGTSSIALGYCAKSDVVSNNRWYYVKLFSGGRMVRELIPCVHILGNKPGMYDTVSGNFWTNAGTGELVAGPDVIATEVSEWLMARRMGMMRGAAGELYPVGTDIVRLYIRDSDTPFVEGTTISTETGEIIETTNTHYASSAFAPINPAYTYQKNGVRVRLYWYDKQYQYIGYKIENNTTTKNIDDIPQNAAYMRLVPTNPYSSDHLTITRTA